MLLNLAMTIGLFVFLWAFGVMVWLYYKASSPELMLCGLPIVIAGIVICLIGFVKIWF